MYKKDIGKVVLIGLPRYQESITIDPAAIFKGKSLIGNGGRSIDPDIDFPRYVELYLSGNPKLFLCSESEEIVKSINDVLMELLISVNQLIDKLD
jgi:Zn-dependent alcohol dehydrogenase